MAQPNLQELVDKAAEAERRLARAAREASAAHARLRDGMRDFAEANPDLIRVVRDA